MHGHATHQPHSGFTLIELSIVLVIIGLIIGGILVGRDLISAAAVRGQISQIDKYSAAINTFVSKYNDMPGDMAASKATTFGFPTGTGAQGDGDGNGMVTPIWGAQNAAVSPNYYEDDIFIPGSGRNTLFTGLTTELGYFWQQLSTANLIEGNYVQWASGTKITPGIHIPAMRANPSAGIVFFSLNPSTHYFFLGATGNSTTNTGLSTAPVLTPIQAQSIDQKIDDGIAGTGKVQVRLAQLGSTNIPDINEMPYSIFGGATACYTNGFDGPAGNVVYNPTNAKPVCNIVIQF